jgi:predicted DNA-binding transcriptional regulator YafY
MGDVGKPADTPTKAKRKKRSQETVLPSQPVEVMPATPPSEPGLIAGRVARLIRLLAILQTGEYQSVESIGAKLSVSRRTVFRDLKVLERADVPFINTPRGYTLKRGYTMAQLNLGAAESLGLMVLSKVARGIPHQPLFSAAINAISRCLRQLPPASLAVYEDLVRHVSYAPGFVNISKEDEQHFVLLQTAIDERQVCRLRYQPVGEHAPVRTSIEPVHLHFYKHSWYVLAFSRQHDEIRMFKLARITELKATRETFEPIPFSIDRHLDGAWGIIPGGKMYDVVIEFTRKVARNVSEIRWHHSQVCEFQPDGSCVLRFCVNGLDEMSWWLFSYADQAVVREPAELREKIRVMAQRTLEANSDARE